MPEEATAVVIITLFAIQKKQFIKQFIMTGSQENIRSSIWESIINYGKNFKHSTAKKQENKEKRQK